MMLVWIGEKTSSLNGVTKKEMVMPELRELYPWCMTTRSNNIINYSTGMWFYSGSVDKSLTRICTKYIWSLLLKLSGWWLWIDMDFFWDSSENKRTRKEREEIWCGCVEEVSALVNWLPTSYPIRYGLCLSLKEEPLLITILMCLSHPLIYASCMYMKYCYE